MASPSQLSSHSPRPDKDQHAVTEQSDIDANASRPMDAAASVRPRRFRPGAGKTNGSAPGRVPPATYDTVEFNAPLAELEAREISAWFGDHMVLEGVSLTMHAGQVTALIGPSGCGKSTFLRILNRMHELVPGAALSGSVTLDGVDIYERDIAVTDTRRRIGMVFQKPNPFPAMSITENVTSGLRLSGLKVNDRKGLVERCLTSAGLWREVKDRLGSPGGALSGGQQQ